MSSDDKKLDSAIEAAQAIIHWTIDWGGNDIQIRAARYVYDYLLDIREKQMLPELVECLGYSEDGDE